MVKVVFEAFERHSTLAGNVESSFLQEFWAKRLWDDLQAHEAAYELFLAPKENYVWTERCRCAVCVMRCDIHLE